MNLEYTQMQSNLFYLKNNFTLEALMSWGFISQLLLVLLVIGSLFAFYLYNNADLGFVMASAMVLNLILAAIMGVLMPLLMHRLGKDPAVGSSVLITAMTDSGGFFIFLGLATLVLT